VHAVPGVAVQEVQVLSGVCTMKRSGMILGFIPLVVYGVLAGNSVTSVTIALAAAIATYLIVGWTDLRNGMMMSWANVVMFGSALIAIGVFGIVWIVPYMGILIYATLAAFTFGSILIGMPFTLQYARGMVDRTLWEKPRFIRVNVMITGIWGGVFLVNLGLSSIAFIMPGLPGRIAQVSTYIVLAAGALFTLWYPERVRKKIPVMAQ
jgi:hypothetical protein